MRRISISWLTFCLLVAPVLGNNILLSSQVFAQATDARKVQADQLYQEADHFLKSYMFQAAQVKWSQALRLYQQIADATGQRETLIGLGLADYGLGRYREALQYLRQAESMGGDFRNSGRLLTAQGLVYLELGEYWQAYNLLTRASGSQLQNIAEENRNRIGLGEAHRYLGQYKKALTYLQLAERTSGDRGDYGRTLNAIGDVYFEIGQYEDAQNYYQKALAVRQSVGDKMGMLRTLNNLGRVKRELGAFPEALKLYQQALDWVNSLGDENSRVLVLNNLGLVALDMGLKNQALDYLEQALSATRNYVAGRVQALNNLGLYYRQQGEYDKAIAYYQEAIGWAKKNGDRVGEAKALSGLGETQLELKKNSEAIQSLQASAELFESLRPLLRDEEKISLFETQSATYRTWQAALIEQGDYTTSLTVSERGRARAFVELLAKRLSDQPGLELVVEPPTLAEIQATAASKQATLVSYSILYDSSDRESKLYIWVINPQGIISFRSVDLPTSVPGSDKDKQVLTNLVVSLRDNLTIPSSSDMESRSLTQEVYQILIEPIADLLPADPQARVIFIPQGSLFLVPFQALQDASGKFLIEKHAILFAPSIQALSLHERQKGQQADESSLSLVVGNPEPMPADLVPLPGAEVEAKAVAQILATQPLLGGQATETTVFEKMSQARIIHFATHGLLDEREALESSLAFVPSQNQDGLMTAGEIFEMKLQADLAVLSACDTGRGTITGDGVIGLSRSLMSAGVSSVVVSLWEVPDQSTASLMVEFYRNLQNTPDKAQALRQAMLTQIKQTPAPRDWAGFILIGAAD